MSEINIGDFLLTIIRLLVELPKKLYQMLMYEVSLDWLSKFLSFFDISLNLPQSISLISILGTVGGATLIIIILYNIFKL